MPECTATKEQIIEARNLLWPDGPPEQIPIQQCLRVAQALADRDAVLRRCVGLADGWQRLAEVAVDSEAREWVTAAAKSLHLALRGKAADDA